MADIFDEVDEDLRADRAQALLRRFGPLLVVLGVVIVVLAAGWQGWHWWQNKQQAAFATDFIQAMRLANVVGPDQAARRPEAIAAFEKIASNAPEGYRTLARLREAALKANGGDTAGAGALWDQVAADRAADALLRDLASLMWVQHQLGNGDPSLIEARLKPIASPDNPWHILATEAQALLYMREGKNDDAKQALRRIVEDVTAPEGARARANGMLARLGA